MAKKIIQNKIEFINIRHKEWKILTPSKLKQWIFNAIEQEKYILKKINFTFLSDDELLKINIDFLHHHYYTDVITFDYSIQSQIAGEIFISIDTVKKNADIYNQKISTEIYRVIIHGVLHLCQYKDKTLKEKEQMTEKENFYLQQISNP